MEGLAKWNALDRHNVMAQLPSLELLAQVEKVSTLSYLPHVQLPKLFGLWTEEWLK